LYEGDEDREQPPRRARHESAVQPTDFLIPTNVSGWSILSCYLGLIGFCLPFIGLVFAIPAFVFGIVALLNRSRSRTYGAVTSDVRAVIGLILSSLAILGWGSLLIVMLTVADVS
jgi:hypothetical protein